MFYGKVRTITTAEQYQKVLKTLLSFLDSYVVDREARNDIGEDIIVYDRDGYVKIDNILYDVALHYASIDMMFDYFVDDSGLEVVKSIKIDEVVKFIDHLVVESVYDLELAESYYCPKENIAERGKFLSVSDEFIAENKVFREKMERYFKIRNDVNWLCSRLDENAPMIDEILGVVNDFILSNYYRIDGFLPERFLWFKKNINDFYFGNSERDGFKDRPIKVFNERFQNTYYYSRDTLMDFFRNREFLFADLFADEYARYVMTAYYFNWIYVD